MKRFFGAAALIASAFFVSNPAQAACGKVTISDMNWPSATFMANLDKLILQHGFGCDAELIPGGIGISPMSMIEKGEPDIAPEMWYSSAEALKKGMVEKRLRIAGKSLSDGGEEGFWVPQYMVDKDPSLATIAGIKKNAKLFKHPEDPDKSAFIGCPAGWNCQITSGHQFKALKLADAGFELVNPGSLAALDAEIIDAYQKKENILHYYWGPTTLTHKLSTELGGYVQLEEPAYTKECAASDWGCAYPLAEVLIAVRKDLQVAAPEIAEFLTKWDFTAGNQLAAEGYMSDSGAEYPEVAAWFLKNTEDWKTWVAPGIADKVLEGL